MLKILIFIFLSFNLHARDLEQLSSKISEIKTIDFDNFPEEIEKINKEVNKLFKYQKGICKGEFTALVLGDEEKTEIKKLSKAERTACYQNLKVIQRRFIEISYKKRKEYLNHVHGKRLEELDHDRVKLLDSIAH